MDQNVETKIESKEKIKDFYKANKLKVLIIVLIFLVIISLITSFNLINKKKNNLIAEKYIEAGITSNSNNEDKASSLYEEIILKKNKFYSILALNIILEKNLIVDNDKILEYFKVIEEINKSREQADLINFKKALFLIKISKNDEGINILRNLIKNESKLKILAQEILDQ